MNSRILFLGLSFSLIACEVGLATSTNPDKINSEEPSSEPSFDSQPSSEPSGETNQPSSETSNEPSSDPNDADGDGYPASQDCNDYNPDIYPGAYDIPNDGIDQDCNGVDANSGSANDSDGDGYDSAVDCNDYNPSVNPGAYDIPNNGIDEDCSGSDAGSGSSGGGSYSGWENFKYMPGGSSTGYYECDMNFTISGSNSTISCPYCDYAFDVVVSYNSSGSTASSTCSSLTAQQNFSYGFSSNYNGSSALLLYTGYPYYTWNPWILNGNQSYNRTDTVSFTASSFSYNVGYLDYYVNNGYYFGVYSYYFSGGGTQ